MYDPDQILDIVDGVVELYRRNQRGREVDYRPLYSKEVGMAKDQMVHALGIYPQKLFNRKVPNETPAQAAYRRESYEPTTMPYWNKAVQAVQGRVWNQSNHHIEWHDNDEKAYFTSEYPKYGSLVNYFRSVRLPHKMYDANAVMCIFPKSLPVRETEEGIVIDDTQLIEPECTIYPCESVMSYKDNDHVLVLTDENSWVDFGNGKVQEGLVFRFIDRSAIYTIYQVGKKIDWQFEVALYYTHGLDKLPAERLKGVPKEKKGVGYYQSYFWPAVGDLNTALFDESTLNIAKIANVFSERWEVVENCQTCDGEGEVFRDGDKVTCDSCGGTGTNQRPHPLNAITIKLPDRLDDRPQAPTPPAGYLQKETDSVRFLREEIDKKKQDAFAHLNIDVSSSPNGQTATESKIDREELFSFLLTIASEEFEALAFAIYTIGEMRYGPDFDSESQIIIDPPKDFTIRSYKELTAEINEAREAKLPQIAFRKLLDEYNGSRFNMDSKMGVINDIVFEVDRLIGLTNDEVARQVMAGIATKQEAVIHTSIYTFIDQLLREDEEWLSKERRQQVADIQAKANAIQLSNPDTNILNQL